MAVINYLLNESDNSEKIRDAITYILKDETNNQYNLAREAAAPDKRDYKIKVQREDERVLNIASEKNIFSIINVSTGNINPVVKSSVVQNQQTTAEYFIDCYASGNFEGADKDENDSQSANIKAIKTARVARNILMAGLYTYLGCRDIVSRRVVRQIQPLKIPGQEESAVSVAMVRLILEVEFTEYSPQTEGVPLEEINFKALANILGKEIEVIDIDFNEED